MLNTRIHKHTQISESGEFTRLMDMIPTNKRNHVPNQSRIILSICNRMFNGNNVSCNICGYESKGDKNPASKFHLYSGNIDENEYIYASDVKSTFGSIIVCRKCYSLLTE